MIVYRLCKEKYAAELSGIGAEKFGGRWNSKGVPMIYTSTNISLCTLELFVQINHDEIPNEYVLMYIEVPDSLKLDELSFKQLPADWRLNPPSRSTQKIGDAFINNNKTVSMKVPSAVVADDFNVLINPNHSSFSKIKIIKTVKFNWDGRLFGE